MCHKARMNEHELIEKLRLVENLFAGATTDGERDAASNAMDRIKKRLQDAERTDPAIEYKFSLRDMWARRLFVALLRRYDIRPYRYARQRYTTVMARVPRSFVEKTLWPEYQELNRVLNDYLEETTERVISQGVWADNSEAEEIKSIDGAPHEQD